MILITLKEIIEYLPNILQYFVPGYIFSVLICHIFSVKEEFLLKSVKSCVASFVFITGVKYIGNAIWHCELTVWQSAFFATLAGVISAIIIGIVGCSKTFRTITTALFNKSIHNQIWRDVFDYKNGTNLKVSLKDKDYYVIGHLHAKEDKEGDAWICLQSPMKYVFNKDGEDTLIYDQSKNDDVFAFFNLRDIDSIEAFL